TRALIRLEAHSDIYAIPDLWMLGADQSIFKNADGSLKAAWQVVMGRIKGIPDDDDAENPRADVKQFPAATPEPHLASLNAYAKMFARATSLPDTAVAITDLSNPTSAEAYDASQYELIAEAEGATDDWSPYLRRAVVRALARADGIPAGEIPPKWATIAPRWRDPRYLSRAAQADAGMKQLSAIPWLADTEVGLELLGLDEQQIARALADRRRADAQQRLSALAAAAQAARRDRPMGAQTSGRCRDGGGRRRLRGRTRRRCGAGARRTRAVVGRPGRLRRACGGGGAGGVSRRAGRRVRQCRRGAGRRLLRPAARRSGRAGAVPRGPGRPGPG